MKRTRRPAYMLIQILALLPLIAVAAAMTTQLTGSGILAERLAMTNSANDAESHLMLPVLKEDAALATSASVESDEGQDRLTLQCPDYSITYRIVKKDFATTVIVSDDDGERIRFNFHRADIRFAIEKVDDVGAVVWVRFTFTNKWNDRDIRAQSLAGAARLGKDVTR